MMRRATWFVAGAAAGAGGAVYAGRKVRQAADKLKPVNVARTAADRARQRGRDVVAAVRDGRAAMAAKEAELRAERDRDAGAGLPAPVVPGVPGLPGPVTVQYVIVDARDAAGVLGPLDDVRARPDGPRRRSRR